MSAQQKEKSRMAEESSSGSSGSPSPGDTLPWNLPRHQRTKRTKSASGNGTVLDPAERAVIRIAEPFEKVSRHVDIVYLDFRKAFDGSLTKGNWENFRVRE